MAIAPEKSMNELGAEFYTLMGNAISNWVKVEAYRPLELKSSVDSLPMRWTRSFWHFP